MKHCNLHRLWLSTKNYANKLVRTGKLDSQLSLFYSLLRPNRKHKIDRLSKMIKNSKSRELKFMHTEDSRFLEYVKSNSHDKKFLKQYYSYLYLSYKQLGTVFKRLNTFKGKITDYMLGKGPLETSRNCFYIGMSSIKSGSRLSKKVPMNTAFVDFILTLGKESELDIPKLAKIVRSRNTYPLSYETLNKYYLISLNELINYREVYTSGYDMTLPLLMECSARQDRVPIKIIREAMENGGLQSIEFPQLDFVSDDLMDIKIKPDSQPGPLSKIVFGPTRQVSIFETHKITKDLLKLLDSEPIAYNGLWEMLGREKDIKLAEHNPELEYASTRLNLNCEEPFMLLGQLYFQPIINAIKGKPGHQITIGKGLEKKEINYLEENMDKYYYAIELDWPHFDINVDLNELSYAYSILRNCYPSCDHESLTIPRPTDVSDEFIRKSYKTDRVFASMLYMATCKAVLLPNGHVYEVRQGLPSGMPATSLIGSVVNYVRLCVISYHLLGKDFHDKIKIRVHGDDTLLLVPKLDNLHDRILDIAHNVLGKQLDDVKIVRWTDTTNFDDRPTYLKRKYISDLGPIWDRPKIIRKLIYQPRLYDSFYEKMEVVINYMIACPKDYEFNSFLMYYLHFLYENYDTVMSWDFYKDLINDMLDTALDRDFIMPDYDSGNKTIRELLSRNPVRPSLRVEHKDKSAYEVTNLLMLNALDPNLVIKNIRSKVLSKSRYKARGWERTKRYNRYKSIF